ncbi:hypothetical protein [Pseudorhodoferax sp.]|uniref:hypothetical protein n=1 Tax=Pseudorhodoferax sp. TaxID=1993553 RepID=UPI002DD64F4D|nr:hypothetical protein [Pseudorhodoferax sp.]
MIKATFTGTVTMYSSIPGNKGPKLQPVKFQAEFLPDGTWTIEPKEFEVVKIEQPTDDATAGALEASLSGRAEGKFAVEPRSLSLNATFTFAIEGMDPSDLVLQFDHAVAAKVPNGTVVQGIGPDRKNGTFALAAGSTFVGGALKHKDCTVLISGWFEPNPWK